MQQLWGLPDPHFLSLLLAATIGVTEVAPPIRQEYFSVASYTIPRSLVRKDVVLSRCSCPSTSHTPTPHYRPSDSLAALRRSRSDGVPHEPECQAARDVANGIAWTWCRDVVDRLFQLFLLRLPLQDLRQQRALKDLRARRRKAPRPHLRAPRCRTVTGQNRLAGVGR